MKDPMIIWGLTHKCLGPMVAENRKNILQILRFGIMLTVFGLSTVGMGQMGWPVVQEGDNGVLVEVVQHLLNEQGLPLEADGDFGPLTFQAVVDFQIGTGLDATGIANDDTWKLLAVPLEEGSSGEAVIALQKALVELHTVSMGVDGIFGSQTLEAVVDFQLFAGLDAIGIVDAFTWLSLLSQQSIGVPPGRFNFPSSGFIMRFKVFIPAEVEGGKSVPEGPHKGKIMIDGPIHGISDCFLTDNRSFSTDPAAEARVVTSVTIIDNDPAPLVDVKTLAGRTTEVDCEDGDVEEEGTADTSRSTHQVQFNADGTITVRINIMANNPMFSGSPDIDYDGVFQIDMANNTLAFSGRVEPFPAFEGYLHCDNGLVRTLFQRTPNLGTTPFNLPFDANQPLNFTSPLCF